MSGGERCSWSCPALPFGFRGRSGLPGAEEGPECGVLAKRWRRLGEINTSSIVDVDVDAEELGSSVPPAAVLGSSAPPIAPAAAARLRIEVCEEEEEEVELLLLMLLLLSSLAAYCCCSRRRLS